MTINYKEIMNLTSENVEISYSDKDSILYSLGIGLGNDPMDLNNCMFTKTVSQFFHPWLPIFNIIHLCCLKQILILLWLFTVNRDFQ